MLIGAVAGCTSTPTASRAAASSSSVSHAAVHSTSPSAAGLTVSTPLEWKEIKKGLDPGAFTIHTIEKRLARKGDLWEKITDARIISYNKKQLQRLLQ